MASTSRGGRDALVSSGGVLFVWGAVLLVYLQWIRVADPLCSDGQVLANGFCWTVWKFLVPVVLLGLALLIVGFTAFRPQIEYREDLLRSGWGLHLTLALMATLAVFPLLAAIVVNLMQDGQTISVAFGGGAVALEFLLLLVGIAGSVAFLVAFAVHARHTLMVRRYLTDDAWDEHDAAWQHEADMEETWQPAEDDAWETEHAAYDAPSDEGYVWQAVDEPETVPGERQPDEVVVYDGPPTPARGSATAEPVGSPSAVCAATTAAGNPCKNKAQAGSNFCHLHG